MQQSIEIFAAINFLIIGLSHIFQHRTWAAFFIRLHEMGRTGAFVGGFLSLFMGTLIVAFHNVWTGVPAVLTVVGWAMVLKAAVVFLRPDWGLRSLARVREHSSRIFIIPGMLLVMLAVALAYTVSQS